MRGGLTSDLSESMSVVSAIVVTMPCGGDAMVVLFSSGDDAFMWRCVEMCLGT